MPLAGLIDERGKEITWAKIKKGMGKFVDPLPVLLALYQDRESYCDFSITELINDPYQLQMTRRYDYFESVDQLADRMFGSAFHCALEQGGALKGMETECRMSVKIKGIVIGGTCDLILHDEEGITDYKTVTMSKLRMIQKGKADALDSYTKQLNGYRFMHWKKTGDDYDTLKARLFVRDWRFYEFRRAGQDYMMYPRGLNLEVPTMPMKKIAEWMEDRTAQHVVAERVEDEELHTVGECASTWGGLRCTNYCPVSDICHFRLMNPVEEKTTTPLKTAKVSKKKEKK